SNCARVQFEHGQCTLTRVIRPRLAVRICGPVQAALNEVLTFQIAVSNRGEVEATGVGLIEKLPDGLEHASGKNTLAWDIGALAPGQCRTVEYQVTARKPGRFCMRVAASANDSAFDEAEACVDVGQQAGPAQPPQQPAPPGQPLRPAPAPGSLSVIKRGPEQRALRNPATYQITVVNNGATPVTNVVVTDILPPRTNIVSISDAGRSTGEQVQWAIGTVPPGARRTVQIALQAQGPGEIVNRATATADGGLTANDQARTVFEGAAGLTFDVEVRDNPLEVGARTSYFVTVLNQGVAPATKVQISVVLPEGVEMLDAKGPSNHKQDGRQVTFEALPMLAAGKEERYEIQVKAQRAGQVKCRAELRADQLGDRPVVREQSTTIYDPGVARPAVPPPGPPPN
ncbi:MAG: DUF11 domain-containing protein, partial [Planctomycetia bacterium]|nr:DUF11 domain-containing protein [Planctomycetia bacterium]